MRKVTTKLKPTLGTLHLWGLAVGLVISGEYFGWSYGWGAAGTLGFLITALMVLRIIAAIWVALTFSGQGGILASGLIGGFAVIILLLLWNGPADRFFREN